MQIFSSQSVPELLTYLWQKPPIRLLAYICCVVLFFHFTRKHLSNVLLIVSMAYAISYITNPLLLWFEKYGIRRGMGVSLLLAIFSVATLFIFWSFAAQVMSFVAGLPTLLNRLPELLENMLDKTDAVPGIAHTQEKLSEYVREEINKINENLGPLIGQVLSPESAVVGQVTGLLNGIGQVTFILTLAVFFMIDHARMGQAALRLFPKDWRPAAENIVEDISLSFGSYVRGQLLTGAAISLISAIGLLILGVPNALVFGLLTGLFNLIPVVGMLLATIPVLLQALPMGTATIVTVCILYFLLNQVAWNVLAPILVGRTSKLSASSILIAILIGATLSGLLGALLAIPTASLLKRWIERYWVNSASHASLEDSDGRLPQPDPDELANISVKHIIVEK